MAKEVITQTKYTCDICGHSRNHQGIENCSIRINRSDELAGFTSVYNDVCDTCRKEVLACICRLRKGENDEQ